MKTYVLLKTFCTVLVTGLFLAVTVMPAIAMAQVQFSEIAWMGVAGKNGQYGEWFELYNDTTTPVDVTGWKVLKESGTKVVAVLPRYTIAAHSYLVVERVTASVPDPVPSVNNIAMAFSNSGLSNSGEDLVLQDAQGVTIQTLSYGAGWPAGDSTTKETMQYNGTVWGTALGTPGMEPPAQFTITTKSTDSTITNTNSSTSTDVGEVTAELSVDDESENEVSGAVVFKHIPASISFSVPHTMYTAVQYPFTTTVVYDDMRKVKGYFVWNFGDGTVVRSDTITTSPHAYRYAGKYTLSFAYYNRKGDTVPLLQAQTVLTVQDPSLVVYTDADTIVLHNKGVKSIDVSHWFLVFTDTWQRFALPEMTILAQGASIRMPLQQLGERSGNTGFLYTPLSIAMATIGTK